MLVAMLKIIDYSECNKVFLLLQKNLLAEWVYSIGVTGINE